MDLKHFFNKFSENKFKYSVFKLKYGRQSNIANELNDCGGESYASYLYVGER